MIPRTLVPVILSNRKPGFINLIYGPRRVGKTILLGQIADRIKLPGVKFDGDNQETRDALSQTSQVTLSALVKDSQAIYIDEAQRIPNIGLSLKILIDTFPQKNFFVTGSSSLSLARGLQEPLTGRLLEYKLYPLSTTELTSSLPGYQKNALLENQLLFGSYPQLQQLASASDKQQYLKSITKSYLFQDILLLKDVAYPENLTKLATLLAFQIGSQVSYHELAQTIGVDVKTITRYLYLLKQAFVIFELGSYAKSLRKEIAKSKKYYFWDLGIRNALIDQFHSLDVRPDSGQLWENFLAVERLKKHEYSRQFPRYFFWRTYDQAEIDWLEETEGRLSAYEFKYSKTSDKTPKAFKDAYGQTVTTLSPQNYLNFVT